MKNQKNYTINKDAEFRIFNYKNGKIVDITDGSLSKDSYLDRRNILYKRYSNTSNTTLCYIKTSYKGEAYEIDEKYLFKTALTNDEWLIEQKKRFHFAA